MSHVNETFWVNILFFCHFKHQDRTGRFDCSICPFRPKDLYWMRRAHWLMYLHLRDLFSPQDSRRVRAQGAQFMYSHDPHIHFKLFCAFPWSKNVQRERSMTDTNWQICRNWSDKLQNQEWQFVHQLQFHAWQKHSLCSKLISWRFESLFEFIACTDLGTFFTPKPRFEVWCCGHQGLCFWASSVPWPLANICDFSETHFVGTWRPTQVSPSLHSSLHISRGDRTLSLSVCEFVHKGEIGNSKFSYTCSQPSSNWPCNQGVKGSNGVFSSFDCMCRRSCKAEVPRRWSYIGPQEFSEKALTTRKTYFCLLKNIPEFGSWVPRMLTDTESTQKDVLWLKVNFRFLPQAFPWSYSQGRVY